MPRLLPGLITMELSRFKNLGENVKDKDLLQAPLYSYTVCHRFNIKYDRPRMYIFTYAYDDKDANEIFSG